MLDNYSGFEGEAALRDGRRVQIRKIGATDGQLIRNFHESLSAESWYLWRAHLNTDEVIDKHISRFLSGEDWGYLALADGKAVSYFFFWNARERVPLLGICIADDHQNCGLGSALLDILIEDAKTLGKDGIELTTMTDNDRAFHLYLGKGFVYTGDVNTVAGTGEVVVERRMVLPMVEGDIRTAGNDLSQQE